MSTLVGAGLVTDLVIGGAIVPGDGPPLEVLDPATEAVVATVAAASTAQLDAAVGAARDAFDDGPWGRLDGAGRANLLAAACAHLREHRDLLTDLLVAETGCPVGTSGPFQVDAAFAFLSWYAEAARTDHTRTLPPDATTDGVVRFLPVGVVGAISAYNYPLLLAVNKLGAALAAGCTVVLMPSPATPLATLLMGKLLLEGGLPPGVLNVVVGGADVARRLTEHDDVDKVSFTGSVEVGSAVAQQAAASIKASVLELGGKSPCILLPGVDLDEVVAPLLGRLFRHAGQGCQVPSRIVLHRSDLQGFADRAQVVIDAMVVGDPTDPATDVGPVISRAHRDRVQGYVDDAVAGGAQIVASATLPAFEHGHWVAPTIVGGVGNEARIAREEIFGPVGVLLPYEDVEEAVAIANDTSYGLAAYVFGPDAETALSVGSRLRAGSVFVNGGGLRPDAPSGGFKQSGSGREQGEEGVREFLEPQHLRWAR